MLLPVGVPLIFHFEWIVLHLVWLTCLMYSIVYGVGCLFTKARSLCPSLSEP